MSKNFFEPPEDDIEEKAWSAYLKRVGPINDLGLRLTVSIFPEHDHARVSKVDWQLLDFSLWSGLSPKQRKEIAKEFKRILDDICAELDADKDRANHLNELLSDVDIDL